MNRKIVIKVGGSILFDEKNKIHTDRIASICEIILKSKNSNSVIIVCGGGMIAREYITTVRKFSKNEILCDLVGIDVSRINSQLLISYFGSKAYPIVPKTIEAVALACESSKIVVMGGLLPAQSTTSVAIEIAEYFKANCVIILTDVDGIYDKNPKIYKDAKLLSKITLDQLERLIISESKDTQAAAGEYRILDAVSLQILKRNKIPVCISSGRKLENFRNLMQGAEDFIGTIIGD